MADYSIFNNYGEPNEKKDTINCHVILLGEGDDPANPVVTGNPGDGCPSGPQPFIQNENSSVASLVGDRYNGTQLDEAGRYQCVLNGEIRTTVEIRVLGKENYMFLLPICSFLITTHSRTYTHKHTEPEFPPSFAYYRYSIQSEQQLITRLNDSTIVLEDCIQFIGVSVSTNLNCIIIS